MPSTVTVVVPAHNEEASIAATVSAIRTQTYPVSRVLVVDDGSTDGTAVEAIAAGAEVLAAPGGSKPRAQNIALATVDTDVVVGVDADTVLAPDAIEHLVKTIDAGADGTCGAVLPAQRRGVWVRGRAFDYAVARRWLKPVQQRLGRIHVLSGAVYGFRATALRAVGGHPETAIGEDTELTWRMYQHGFKLRYSPEAIAYTREPESFTEFWRQSRRWSASQCQVIRRHWRQLSHPGRALIVATAIWDCFAVAIMWLAVAAGTISNPSWSRLVGPWFALMALTSTAVAARTLGWRYAIACLPSRMVTAMVTRVIYATTYIREWVLGRHYLSWTGRQSRASVISPMSSRRRVAFSGLTGAGALVLVICALETTAALTGQSSPTRQALAFVAPIETPAVTLSQPLAAEASSSRSQTVPTPTAIPRAPRAVAPTSPSDPVPEPAEALAAPVYQPSPQAVSGPSSRTELRKQRSSERRITTTSPKTIEKPNATTTVPTTAIPPTTTTTLTDITTTTSAPASAESDAGEGEVKTVETKQS